MSVFLCLAGVVYSFICSTVDSTSIVRVDPAQFKVNFYTLQGTLVPKLTLGPFLTLSVFKDCGFRIPAHIESKSL